MSKKDNVDKIKSYIDDILGTNSSLKDKLPSKLSVKKELFCDMLKDLQFVNDRTMGLKHDYKMNMMAYDDPFYTAIENLIKIRFTQEQQNIINWWLYDKFLPTGETLILTDKDTEEIIPSDTPEDIWDLIQDYEKKDTK
ncbi:MAG: hypothetical protein H8D84_01350 [Proteobacteria bacterium]|nr:hypothetical protein [Pseudomonadota bacterium]